MTFKDLMPGQIGWPPARAKTQAEAEFENYWRTTTAKYAAGAAQVAVTKPNAADFDDAVLIMELLSRGYAVAKMPAEELASELGK